MTDNIQKLYEIAGVKPLCQIPDGYCGMKNVYSDFDTEKQLELIKWLAKKTYRNYFKLIYSFEHKSWYMESDYIFTPNIENFENTLAGLVCKLWEYLSDNQKQEIKEILQ